MRPLNVSRGAIAALAFLAVLVLLYLGQRQPGEPLPFDAEVRVALPADAVWRRMEDLSLAHHYVPGILSTEITTSSARGVGASRRVYSSGTDYLNETVIDWREGRGFTLRLHGDDDSAPAPFSQAEFSYSLIPDGEAQTRVVTRLNVVMSGGAIGQWFGETLLAGAFEERTRAVAEGLKEFYEAQDVVE